MNRNGRDDWNRRLDPTTRRYIQRYQCCRRHTIRPRSLLLNEEKIPIDTNSLRSEHCDFVEQSTSHTKIRHFLHDTSSYSLSHKHLRLDKPVLLFAPYLELQTRQRHLLRLQVSHHVTVELEEIFQSDSCLRSVISHPNRYTVLVAVIHMQTPTSKSTSLAWQRTARFIASTNIH